MKIYIIMLLMFIPVVLADNSTTTTTQVDYYVPPDFLEYNSPNCLSGALCVSVQIKYEILNQTNNFERDLPWGGRLECIKIWGEDNCVINRGGSRESVDWLDLFLYVTKEYEDMESESERIEKQSNVYKWITRIIIIVLVVGGISTFVVYRYKQKGMPAM